MRTLFLIATVFSCAGADRAARTEISTTGESNADPRPLVARSCPEQISSSTTFGQVKEWLDKSCPVGHDETFWKVVETGSTSELNEWREHLPVAVDRERLSWLLAKRHFADGQLILAKRDLANLESATYQTSKTELQIAIDRRAARIKGRIVALLPLSGDMRKIGFSIKKQIDNQFATGSKQKSLEWVFIDSQKQTADSLKTELLRANPTAILGPVGRRESALACEVAGGLQLPIALLGVSESCSPWSFSMWFDLADEARSVAALLAKAGHESLAALVPDDELHTRMILALEQVWPSRFFHEQHSAEKRALEQAVRKLLGMPARKSKTDKGPELAPELAFDTLYLPGPAAQALIVTSFLPYFHVEIRRDEIQDATYLRSKHGKIPSIVQLVLGSEWQAISRLAPHADLLEGAWITSTCSSLVLAQQNTTDSASDLPEATPTTAATVFSAQVEDAISLVSQAASRSRDAEDSSAKFVAELSHGQIEPGACGPAWIEKHKLMRNVELFRYTGDELVPVNASSR